MDFPSDRLDRLMADWRAGDRAAYRAFLSEAAIRLRAFLMRRVGAATDVEDLVQECLIAMHEKSATLDPRRPAAPWMFAIARYKLADHWRRQGRSLPVTDQMPEIAVPADELPERDVAVLLGRLPKLQAEAVRMTHIEGMTGSEASRRAGIGLSALKLRVHRGMAHLRKIVAEGE